MGVYISGMEMPKVAGRMEAVITILKDGTAQIAISPADDGIGYWKEYPLIFVPEHGRLIESKAFLKVAHETDDFSLDELAHLAVLVAATPTIIPAEEE